MTREQKMDRAAREAMRLIRGAGPISEDRADEAWRILRAAIYDGSQSVEDGARLESDEKVYCVRCHTTDELHNPPGTISLHAARKDALGHPYPPACDKFTPPATVGKEDT